MNTEILPAGEPPSLPGLHREFGGIRGLADAVRTGRLSAAELAGAAYRRIEAVDAKVRAFTQVFTDVESRPGGSLAGIPIALKDNIDVAGRVTSQGRALTEHGPANQDAGIVDRLKSAGAAIVGKTNLPEFASSAVTVNTQYGATRNPLDLARTAGGSSGGSAAAVAAGMTIAAIGTDTAGSVLIPAALTGIYGLRPTHGRIGLGGVTGLTPTLDTAGVFALSPDDLSVVLDVLSAGGSTREIQSWSGSRVGVLSDLLDEAAAGVRSSLEDAVDQLRSAGATVVPVRLPSVHEARSHARTIYLAEVAEVYAAVLDPKIRYADTVEQRRAGVTEPAELARAQEFRDRWRMEVGQAFEGVDLLLAPTVPVVAPRLPVDEGTAGLTRFTYPICLAGTPALSVPCGSSGGLPVGLMLVAPWGGEDRLLAAAAALPAGPQSPAVRRRA